MLGTEANFISNGRKLEYYTPALLKVLCIEVPGPSSQSYSLSHWYHYQGSAFWTQSCRLWPKYHGDLSLCWSQFLWTVTLLSQASTGPLQFGITCKHDRHATSHQIIDKRLQWELSCFQSTRSELSINYPFLSKIIQTFFHSSDGAPIQTITIQQRRIVWDMVTKTVLVSRWRTSTLLHMTTNTCMLSQKAIGCD